MSHSDIGLLMLVGIALLGSAISVLDHRFSRRPPAVPPGERPARKR